MMSFVVIGKMVAVVAASEQPSKQRHTIAGASVRVPCVCAWFNDQIPMKRSGEPRSAMTKNGASHTRGVRK